MKLKTKLFIVFGVLFISIAALSSTSIYYVTKLQNQANHEYFTFLNCYKTVSNLQKTINSIRKLTGNCSKDSANCNIREIKNIEQRFDDSFLFLVLYPPDEEITLLSRAVYNEFDDFKKLSFISDHYETDVDRKLYLIEENLHQMHRHLAFKIKSPKFAGHNRSIIIVSAIATVAFLISLSVFFAFPAYISAPVSQLTDYAKLIAEGKYEDKSHLSAGKDEVGEIAHALTLLTDKVQHYEKSNLQQLLIEKGSVEAILKNLNEGIIFVNGEDVVQVINPIAAQILDLDVNLVLGKKIKELLQSQNKLKMLLEELTQKNRRSDSPIKYIFKGEESFYSKEIIPVVARDTVKNPGYIITLKNITQYRKYE